MKKLLKKVISVIMALALAISTCVIDTEHIHAKVEGAEVGVTYTLETTEEQNFEVVEFTAPFAGMFSFTCEYVNEDDSWDGYGYLFDSSVDVDAKIAEANANIENGNTERDDIALSDYIESGDDSDGSMLPYIESELTKGEKYSFVFSGYNAYSYGEFKITIEHIHDETTVKNREINSCAEGGYTGDVCCAIEECGALIEEGTQIEGHTPDNEIVGEVKANCYAEGYSGETKCKICGFETEGITTAVTNHEFENDICKHCGRIQNAEIKKEYILETTESLPYQVVEFTAPNTGTFEFYCDYVYDEGDEYDYWDGYGYLFEGSVDIDTKIETGIQNIKDGNIDSEYVRLSGCISEEDDVNDGLPIIVEELTKDQKYYFVLGGYGGYDFGTAILNIKCLHDETEIKNKDITSCIEGGYSGDIYCKVCGDLVEEGYQIEAGSEHNYEGEIINDAICNNYAEIKYTCTYCGDNYTEYDEEGGYGSHSYVTEGKVSPTCTTDGHTGKRACKYCGDVVHEDSVIKAYHNQTDEDGYNPNYIYDANLKKETCMMDGYTGDVVCLHCDEVFEKGMNISAPGHKFSEGICTVCGIEEGLLPIDEDGYYTIDSLEDFMLFAINSDKSIKGKLTKDITVPDDYEYDEVPMLAPNNSLLDGNGHTISNWNLEDTYYIFDIVEDSTIKNLTIEVNMTDEIDYDFGVLAEEAYNSTFENITINGTLVNTLDDGWYMGGVVGWAENCKFIKCTNNADITTVGGNVGGIVGDGENIAFTDCVNNGDIHAECDEVGGIAGEIDGGTFINCINNGKISTDDEQAGGIIGNAYTSTFTNCINYGDVYAYECAGGIMGEGIQVKVNNCVNNGNISGNYGVAAIIGYAENATIDKVYNTGSVEGTDADTTGTLVYGENDVTVTNSEENHEHKYENEKIIKHATFTEAGVVEVSCVCGDKITGFAPQIGDITLSQTEYAYTGKNITLPTVTVKNAMGEVLNTEFYTVTYADASGKAVAAIKETGTYNVKITFKGTYVGEVTKTITVKKAGGTTTPSVENPAKSKIKKIKNIKKKKIKLTWKKISGVTGYQVRYATNKKFKKATIKTIKKNKTKFTIKKLKKKKYYVQVRAYKVVDGKTYTGKWSKKKAVKVKK